MEAECLIFVQVFSQIYSWRVKNNQMVNKRIKKIQIIGAFFMLIATISIFLDANKFALLSSMLGNILFYISISELHGKFFGGLE